MIQLSPIWLYFENGTFLEAKSFGEAGTKVGEAVFNTSMTGYQEIITDPSYAGQFIIFTMPEIGIVGTNDDDMESQHMYTYGIIIRNLSLQNSNFRSEKSLYEFINGYKGMGICDIDTRYLTKMLRNEGAMMMVASTTINDKEKLKEILNSSERIENINHVQTVSTKISYKHNQGNWNEQTLKYNIIDNKNEKKVLVIDFGVKKSILNCLTQAGLSVEVIPYDFDDKDIISSFKKNEIKGVFLSNGPGDPLKLTKQSQKILNLINAKIPIFGICLGHQLLSIAQGYPTYKLKFGQHGGNHPLLNTQTKKVEITAQNHNYNVPTSIEKIATITHYNLFDNTIEGVKYNDFPVFSVQQHPEASPGPHESRYIFDLFAKML